jgi:hypothetical protein
MTRKKCPAELFGPWEAECELIWKFFCPYSAFPIGIEARKKGLPDCPYLEKDPFDLNGTTMVSRPA